MTQRLLRASLLLFVSLSLEAKTTFNMEVVKKLFLEKKISEAIPVLKEAHQSGNLSIPQQKQISQWLTTFQYDSTLGLFEKTREEVLAADEVYEPEKGFLLILEKEPYNSQVLVYYIGFLLSQNKTQEAKDKILWAKTEMPYLEIYNLFAAWVDLQDKKAHSYSCKATTLSSPEQDFCHYVKLLEKTQLSRAAKPTQEILSLAAKTKIPNKHLVLWKKWKNPLEKQKYLSSCQGMSGKQKKAYLFVPEFCVDKEKETLE